MKQIYDLPTGKLIVGNYEKGNLETLSIGDYGKERNIKADFLGHTKHIDGVENGNMKPLQEKWVMTLSTQYGCPMKCKFCSVPNVKFNGNVSHQDLIMQLYNARNCFLSVKDTDRLNIHFARMGEPLFNKEVLTFAEQLQYNKQLYQKTLDLRIETIHPVLTTSMPKMNKEKIEWYLNEWVHIKNDVYHGQAGLQLSINSTNEKQRQQMFDNMTLTLKEISEIVGQLESPLGRKYCLNFALDSSFEIDAKLLASMFDTDNFLVKITPIHNTKECVKNGYKTIDGYNSFTPYVEVEQQLIDAGFDVITFIPSEDEEKNLITCGNAILGGDTL